MIQVYCPNITERLRYALKLVLGQVCLIKYKIISDKDNLDADLPTINYSGERINNTYQIHPRGLLFENTAQQFEVDFEYGGEERVKLFLTEFDDLGFDIFSASFFLATRYEEYWKHETDHHDRYHSENSLAKKLGFLHLPLINIWAEKLKKELTDRFAIQFPDREFKVINTVDVDNAWAIKNKGLVRAGGAVVKAGANAKFKEVGQRFSVLSGKKSDPYDTYAYLKKVQEEHNVESVYFFLLGDRGSFDKNVSHTNSQLIDLIKSVSQYAKIGIHPSYGSYLNHAQLEKEVKRLEKITGNKIDLARKHFLKLNIPESYRNLEKVGITNDYTMGYAEEVGFRASICTPFTFFDLLQNKELNLTIHPFAYMDGTLNEYLKLSIEEALEKVTTLKKEVELVKGDFIGIWHNETVNERGTWKGWRRVYESSFT